MKPRAFVIMPYGESVKVGDNHPSCQAGEKSPTDIVDFSKVYTELLAPALKTAGCIPCRADEEVGAGDIRTDMFFELATAEIVIADISALNVNVFYELGVRNALCPGGVFLVRGDWPWARPFDVAPDRNYTYKGEFFRKGHSEKVPDSEVANLAKILKQAIKTDAQATGSPVYAHLHGLKKPDISSIQTSKARYFTALHDDWLDYVRQAQSKGFPGHILTLAEEAPSPVHRAKILYEAAKALIGLCRYSVARQILLELLSIQPEHADARIQLAIVLDHEGLSLEAEDQIRRLLLGHEDDPDASDIMGQVYRQLWRLSWSTEPKPGEPDNKLQRARDNYALAAQAFQHFWRAQESHPEAYFSGFNAVLLLAMIDHIFASETSAPPRDSHSHRPPEFGPLQLKDVVSAVRFSAECARRRATSKGDHDQRFWTTAALSGLNLLGSDDPKRVPPALQLIRDACAFPQATLFNLEALKQRLTLLHDLDLESAFAKDAIQVVDEAIYRKRSGCACRKVVLFYGGPTEILSTLRSDATVRALETKISEILDRPEWQIGSQDLGITGGIREGDLLFAKVCLDRGAKVQILLLEPSPVEIAGSIWGPCAETWAETLHQVASHPNVRMLCHEEELGPPLNPAHAKARHNRWLMNTARLAAEVEKPDSTRFYGIVFSSRNPPPTDLDDPAYFEHPAFFIANIRSSLSYRGRVAVVDVAACGEGENVAAQDDILSEASVR